VEAVEEPVPLVEVEEGPEEHPGRVKGGAGGQPPLPVPGGRSCSLDIVRVSGASSVLRGTGRDATRCAISHDLAVRTAVPRSSSGFQQRLEPRGHRFSRPYQATSFNDGDLAERCPQIAVVEDHDMREFTDGGLEIGEGSGEA